MMVSVERKGETGFAPRDNSAEEDENEEVELLEEIGACITRLFRVSTPIRRAVSTDLYAKGLSWNHYQIDNQNDIARVGEKYPKLATEQFAWLQRRLCRAITQRRHYLNYVQNHREQLAGSLHQEDQNQARASEPQISSNEEPLLDSSSRQSTKSSVDGDFEPSTMAKIPKLHELRMRGNKEEITCPFCFEIKQFEDEHEWRRHVFADLWTYLCTFPECDAPYFRDIDEWWQHEMDNHRVDYICKLCEGKPFHLKEQYLAHIKQQHPGTFDASDEKYVIEISRRPLNEIPAQECPCCSDWTGYLKKDASVLDGSAPTSDNTLMVSPTNFKRHVGSHLEHLALFAVPVSSSTEDEAGSNVAIEVDERTLWRKSDLSAFALKSSSVSYPGSSQPHSAISETSEASMKEIPKEKERILSNEFPDAGLTPRERNQPDELEQMYKQAPEGYEQASEPYYTKTLGRANNLGFVYADQGWMKEAKHPDTLDSMVNLASTFREQGQLQEMEEVLQERTDVNAVATSLKAGTPLQSAAREGHLAVIELLLQEKANVNVVGENGRTALQAAAEGGHLAVVERLLQEEADVNAITAEYEGRTALQAAAEGGHLAVVERLLQEEADVNAAAAKYDGRTALQAAAEGGHLAVVERLLQEKADVNAAAAYNGRTALQAAAEGGHLAVVERLLQEKADVNAATAYNRRTALQAAAEGGHLAVVERLIQEKADVNAAAVYNGRTALQAAAEGGHLAVVERLLQEKADVNATAAEYKGRTALQAAIEGGHLALVERLLQEKADVNAAAAEHEGRTALQAAAEKGHLAMVERLLQEEADVNAAAAEYEGRTALQAAAEGGHLAMVERLLQKKADVNAAAAYNGRTALQAAAEGGHLAVVERLLQEKADVNAATAYNGSTALQAAAEGGHLAMVERLLQEEANVNAIAAEYDRRTALQAAAKGGHFAVMDRLLQEKVDVNVAAAKYDGRTTLPATEKRGRLSVTKKLQMQVTETRIKEHPNTQTSVGNLASTYSNQKWWKDAKASQVYVNLPKSDLPAHEYTSMLYEHAARCERQLEYKKLMSSPSMWQCEAVFDGIHATGEARTWKGAKHIASQKICQALGMTGEQ
jgi:ankyrin repeat protein